MESYTIFERMASFNSPRVRWHKVREIKATSRPDALRRFTQIDGLIVAPSYEAITRNTTSIMLADPLFPADRASDHLMLAWPTKKIDFDHYDTDGSLVAAPYVNGKADR